MIAIIDYGMGNLRSVEKAFEVVGADAKVTSRPGDLRRAEKLVFPGVGAFGDAMREVKRRRLVGPITEAIAEGRPFLGLCLGLQLLFETSEEAPGVRGLGILEGSVRRFRAGRLKVPHMGWNTIERPARLSAGGARILKGVPRDAYMYFVHSYYALPADRSVVITTTDYGTAFASGIAKGSLFAFQFHPEKSQETGLTIIQNFAGVR